MAQTTQNTPHNEAPSADMVAWAKAAAERGYAVHNHAPLIGTAPEAGDGFILALAPAPDGFAAVPEALHGLIFQGVAEYVQNRVAQPAAKKDGATRDSVQAVVTAALRNGYKPSKERDKDIVESAAFKEFEAHIRRLVLAQKPDASETVIADHVKVYGERADGKTLLAKYRNTVLEKGTYTPSRKGGKVAAEDRLDLAL